MVRILHNVTAQVQAADRRSGFLKGEASVGLSDDTQAAPAGISVHMPAGLEHSIKAKTLVVMLLVLMK